MDRKILAAVYVIVLLVAVSVVYYGYESVNQPQPEVSVSFNYSVGTATGFINNTLKYPILIRSIYCTLPGNRREAFSNPSNVPIPPGGNSSITLDTAGTSLLPENCTGWRVSYNVS
jgi:hypothetical protein